MALDTSTISIFNTSIRLLREIREGSRARVESAKLTFAEQSSIKDLEDHLAGVLIREEITEDDGSRLELDMPRVLALLTPSEKHTMEYLFKGIHWASFEVVRKTAIKTNTGVIDD